MRSTLRFQHASAIPPGANDVSVACACRFCHGLTLDELLSIRDVLGLPGASPKAFLETCTKALVAALVRFKRNAELHEVAAILGESLHE